MAAFPPNFSKEDARLILYNFVHYNTDGTGSVYVKNGDFVVNKWPTSLHHVDKENLPLLDHMPYPGWTLVHLRAASHGLNTFDNTHPFVKGNWAFCHNGIWSDYAIVKAAYARLYKFKGETDSEVAAQMFTSSGPRNFIRNIKSGGVYFALHKSGKLYAINTRGDLRFAKTPSGIVLASTFPYEFAANVTTIETGWLKFGPKGTIIKKKFQKQRYTYPEKIRGSLFGEVGGPRENSYGSEEM